jgi:hypothetical protein
MYGNISMLVYACLYRFSSCCCRHVQQTRIIRIMSRFCYSSLLYVFFCIDGVVIS